MKILVADDDRVVVELIAGLLREKGHEVIPVYDAMQAVMFAVRQPAPDAILLDIAMPGGTGLVAIRRLRASRNTAHIPLIVVSGTKDPGMPDRVRALGADAFLGKPVDYVALCHALEVLTTRKQEPRAKTARR
jgi:two-component system cell cycle response regulator